VAPALDGLRHPGGRRLAVRVTPDALRRIRAGHPWVFDGSIASVSEPGEPGDLAVVFDADRRFAAIGLWDPTSPIRLRVLHRGRPTPVDAAWWKTAIAASVARRSDLAADPGTTAYRLVHGENDGLPGLVVDRYDTTAVLAVHATSLLPHLRSILPALVAVDGIDRVVLRLARTVARTVARTTARTVAGTVAGTMADTAAGAVPVGLTDGALLLGGPLVGTVPFLEHGLRFDADVRHGQKTGAFLDQRDNRARVGAAAAGARVLDVFCCSGGFSVHAAAGGARLVHPVDRSAAAVATAERALVTNRDRAAVAACEVRTTVGDAFEAMAALGDRGDRYGVVVVDPPSFAHKAADVPAAVRAYAALTRLAVRLLEPGGLLVQASCSSRVSEDVFAATVLEAAAGAGRPLGAIVRTGQPSDHPVGFPEGAYLKAVFARV